MIEIEGLSEIIKRAKAGDEAALRAIYDHCYGLVLFICSKMCDNKEDVKEVVQDTFFKAFKNIHNLREDSKFIAWLRKLAIRECFRKNKRKGVYFICSDDITPQEAKELNENFLPEEYLQKKELREGLTKIIDALPKKQREVIYLFYYADMKAEEIASLNNCSIGSIYQALYIARNSIKSKIEENKKLTPLFSTALVPLAVFLQLEADVFAAESIAVVTGGEMAALGFKAIAKHLSMAKTAFYTAVGVTAAGVVTAAIIFAVGPGGNTQEPPALSVPIIASDPAVPTPAPAVSETAPAPVPEPDAPVEPAAPEETVEAPVLTYETLEPAGEMPPDEIAQEVATPPPEPAESVEYVPEAAPEPEINSVSDILSEHDMQVLEEGGTEDDVNGIINRYSFLLLRQANSSLGEECKLYGLPKGDKMILIGIYIYPAENEWRMKYTLNEADTPLMSSMDLASWMGSH